MILNKGSAILTFSYENYTKKSYYPINSYKLKLNTATNVNGCTKTSMK